MRGPFAGSAHTVTPIALTLSFTAMACGGAVCTVRLPQSGFNPVDEARS